jgi:hypothetical protein
MYGEIWWGNLRERDHVEEPSIEGSYYNDSSKSGMVA